MDLRVPGFDVSKWQPHVDFAKAKAAGMGFVFMRASNGTNPANEQLFVPHWQGARDAGLIRGAYHYFVPSLDAKAQAQLFLSQIAKALAPGEKSYLPAVIDIEALPDGVAVPAYVAGFKHWIDTVEADPHFAGRKTIIYTTQSFWAQLGNPPGFYDRPLWVADYSKDPPRIPPGWASYAFFQNSEKGTVAGIDGPADTNFFNGDIDVLTAMTQPLSSATPPVA